LDSTTQVLTTLIILIALVVSILASQFTRRRRDFYPVRDIPAYTTAPFLVGQAIEAGRRVQLSSGAATLGGASTALALASAEMLYQMARRTAIGGEAPVTTVGETAMLPLMIGAARRAYLDSGRIDRFRPSAIRWAPSSSLALIASLTADIGDEKVNGGIYLGDFNSALALPLEALARRRSISIAGSTQLEGQAVAYALADNVLLGEELFVAGAYMGGSAIQRASLITIDVLRWLIIVVIIGGALLSLRVPLNEGLARLLGGG